MTKKSLTIQTVSASDEDIMFDNVIKIVETLNQARTSMKRKLADASMNVQKIARLQAEVVDSKTQLVTVQKDLDDLKIQLEEVTAAATKSDIDTQQLESLRKELKVLSEERDDLVTENDGLKQAMILLMAPKKPVVRH